MNGYRYPQSKSYHISEKKTQCALCSVDGASSMEGCSKGFIVTFVGMEKGTGQPHLCDI